MKLITYANDWAPSVGGIETVTMVLARGLAAWEATHPGERIAVTVVTQTPANGMNDSALPFRVVRRPSQLEFAKLVRSADIVHVALYGLLGFKVCFYYIPFMYVGYALVRSDGS
jgi:hypothetical protein